MWPDNEGKVAGKSCAKLSKWDEFSVAENCESKFSAGQLCDMTSVMEI